MTNNKIAKIKKKTIINKSYLYPGYGWVFLPHTTNVRQ